MGAGRDDRVVYTAFGVKLNGLGFLEIPVLLFEGG